MEDHEFGYSYGVVAGHLDTLEFALRQLLTELKGTTASNAGAAVRVEEALTQYQNTKTDWVKMGGPTAEDEKFALAVHTGLKEGRKRAVSQIAGDTWRNGDDEQAG